MGIPTDADKREAWRRICIRDGCYSKRIIENVPDEYDDAYDAVMNEADGIIESREDKEKIARLETELEGYHESQMSPAGVLRQQKLAGERILEISKLEGEVKRLQNLAEWEETRLRNDAARAGVTWFGCDTGDHMAERILELNVEVEELKKKVETHRTRASQTWKGVDRLSFELQSKKDYNQIWDAMIWCRDDGITNHDLAREASGLLKHRIECHDYPDLCDYCREGGTIDTFHAKNPDLFESDGEWAEPTWLPVTDVHGDAADCSNWIGRCRCPDASVDEWVYCRNCGSRYRLAELVIIGELCYPCPSCGAELLPPTSKGEDCRCGAVKVPGTDWCFTCNPKYPAGEYRHGQRPKA